MKIAPCGLAQGMLAGLDAAARENSLKKYSDFEFRVAALAWLSSYIRLGRGLRFGIEVGCVGQVGEIAVGDGAEFGADYV
jgi:hypothetical protein